MRIYSLLILGLLFTVLSCKKVEEEVAEANTVMAVDNNRAETESQMILSMSKGGMDRRLSAKTTLDTLAIPPCATETLDTLSNPKRYVIDYGSTNCACWDGKNRRGRLISTWTGSPHDSLNVITTVADSFYLNNVWYEFTQEYTNLGLVRFAVEYHPYFRQKVTKCIVHAPDGTINWTCDRYIEHSRGYLTPRIFQDDEFIIRGSSQGTATKGQNFYAQVLKPLISRYDCRYYQAGSVELKTDVAPTQRIEYGDGACDDKADVYQLGKAFPIKLR